MKPGRAAAWMAFASALLVESSALPAQGPLVPASSTPGIAYLAVDLRSGATLAAERADELTRPIDPGSLIKIATLAAALESGVITARSGMVCAHRVQVSGHSLNCSHPDLQRALLPAEALAHSCNTFFATAAARMPRSSFDRVLTDLGLPTSDPAVPLVAAALGLEGMRVAPRRFIAAIAKIAAEPSPLPWRADTLAAVREGLRGAALYGSARAFGDGGVQALAKTGTLVTNGIARGLVAGVTPASAASVGFVMAVSGGAGVDAASLVAGRLSALARPPRETRVAQPERVRISFARRDGTSQVRELMLDDYVAGVIAGEAASGSNAAALEALAITVRTYAVANLGRHQAEGFDLCDLTHCQVWRRATPAATRAALVTRGQVLLDRGRVARVFYTASCGGYSEQPSKVWHSGDDPAHLPSRRDAECDGQPAWSSDIRVGELQRALAAGRFRGDTLRSVTVVSRTPSERAEWLHLDGLIPDRISGDDLRTLVGRTLGWQYLKSTLFEVRRTGLGFHFEGHGAGHGVGLCVIGAANLAAKGASTTQLLVRYFPGLTVGGNASAPSGPPTSRAAKGASPDIEIVLPPSLFPQQPALRGRAARALASLERSLGVSAPAAIVLRFHPTVESYERDTRRPWYTAASTLGTTIEFLPMRTLQQRHILDTTIAHELAHVLTEPVLAGRPLWVREGVAAHYADEDQAGEDQAAVAMLGPCPGDAAFLKPGSADRLRRARAVAARCVENELRAGKEWQDIGRPD